VIEQVGKMREPIRIARVGKPIGEVVPPSTPGRPQTWLGSLAGTGTMTGDIVSPAVEENTWEVLQK
jgi:hypothetical protein